MTLLTDLLALCAVALFLGACAVYAGLADRMVHGR